MIRFASGCCLIRSRWLDNWLCAALCWNCFALILESPWAVGVYFELGGCVSGWEVGRPVPCDWVVLALGMVVCMSSVLLWSFTEVAAAWLLGTIDGNSMLCEDGDDGPSWSWSSRWRLVEPCCLCDLTFQLLMSFGGGGLLQSCAEVLVLSYSLITISSSNLFLDRFIESSGDLRRLESLFLWSLPWPSLLCGLSPMRLESRRYVFCSTENLHFI